LNIFEEAKTVPGKDEEHSRIDQIFNVQEESRVEFSRMKDKIGAEYAKDIVRLGNYRLCLYNERTFLRCGEVSEENIYHLKLGISI